jgi:hypothetical protein
MDPETSRVARAQWRRKRRRRRVVRGLVRAAFWALVLAGTLVLGIGVGRLAAGDGDDGSTVTIERSRGRLTATLPTTTVVSTRTVVKTKRIVEKKGKAATQPKTTAAG